MLEALEGLETGEVVGLSLAVELGRRAALERSELLITRAMLRRPAALNPVDGHGPLASCDADCRSAVESSNGPQPGWCSCSAS